MSPVRLVPDTKYDWLEEGVPAREVKLEKEAFTVISGEEEELIVNVCADDVPPPGDGFVTVTLAVPAEAMYVVLIVAVSVVLLTYVVGSGLPFQLIKVEV